jgi:hypothetical protein
MIASGVLFNTSHILCCLSTDQVTRQFDWLQEYCLKLVKHPAAKGCTDDGTLAIVPIYIPDLD